ncbi:MAG: hypothetical protein L6Q71_06530 [Planctomycetes bacterium]|nr:hypothetical protein [Planctomycetota bacterium]NUQ34538.1 lipoate--protein ligase family protein [Planctomycetaceae bacterium]
MSRTLFFIDYAEADGPFNMGLDQALFLSPPDRPVLRFYGWNPGTVSLGRFQVFDGDTQALLGGVPVTRRTTGGGAIFHDTELTYSLVGSLDALDLTRREQAYERMHRAWIGAIMEVYGLGDGALCMASAADAASSETFWCFMRRSPYDVVCEAGRFPVCADDHVLRARSAVALNMKTPATRKLLGSAQRSRAGLLLQHGSLAVGCSPIAPWAVGLREISGDVALTPARAAQQLKDAVAKSLGVRLEAWKPSREMIIQAKRIAERQFSARSWIEAARGARAKV